MVLKPEVESRQSLHQKDLNSFFLSNRQRFNRWSIIGFCSAPLIGSFLYRYGYRLSFLKCPLRALTGIPCPTCGMTRSFVASAQGNLEAAIQYHLFGPALFLLFLTVVLCLLWDLKTNRNQADLYRRYFARPSLYFGIGISYLSYYAIRITGLAYTGELSDAFWASPAGRWIIHTHFYVS
jgi:Protein of unknown function (DUF2752)